MKKHDFKKLSALLMAVSMMLSSVGCSETEAEDIPDNDVSQVTMAESDSTEVSREAESKQLTPEDMNRIEICGKTVSLPFSVEELGDEFSIGGKNNSQLYYKEEPFATITSDKNTPELISKIVFSLDWFDVKIAGFCFSQTTTKEDIISEWGEPNKILQHDNTDNMIYLISDNFAITVVMIDGYVHMINAGYRNIDEITYLSSENDYDEIPDDLTIDQLLNMISVDGHQLQFPCSTDDILLLSKDFSIEKIAENDNKISSDLYYKDTCVFRMTYDNDENIYFISIPNKKDNHYVSFSEISLENSIGIEDYFVDITNTQVDELGLINKLYNDDTMKCELMYQRNGVINLYWEKSN
ncbi:MAG: hypothetical protein IJ446_00275 [Oscillospiraceae bacterium]|nr:hypothetical protein [Oscillospiraceae bacterium]